MYFVGSYIESEPLAGALELIRFIAYPDAVRRSHITLRGPYRAANGKIKQWVGCDVGRVRILGVGNFFMQRRRQTTFFKCEVENFKSLVWKPDFPKAEPHITIYDGNFAGFTGVIYSEMAQFPWRFEIQVGRTVVLSGREKVEEFLPVRFQALDAVLNRVMDRRSSVHEIISWVPSERIKTIRRIVGFLHDSYSDAH